MYVGDYVYFFLYERLTFWLIYAAVPSLGLQGKDNIFGSGSGLIVLDNVMCEGNETNLLMCEHNAIFQSNCDHAQDAAVVCEGTISFLTGLAAYYIIMLVQIAHLLQSFIAH